MGWKGGAESIDGWRKNANNSKVQKSALKEVFFQPRPQMDHFAENVFLNLFLRQSGNSRIVPDKVSNRSDAEFLHFAKAGRSKKAKPENGKANY